MVLPICLLLLVSCTVLIFDWRKVVNGAEISAKVLFSLSEICAGDDYAKIVQGLSAVV